MEQTVNQVLRDAIIDNFITDDMFGNPGTFETYKMLQDLVIDYLATGAAEGNSEDARVEFFHRFRLISQTIFDLETLAAQTAINNIKATAGQPAG